MAKLPNRSDMATIDAPADQFQGDDHSPTPSSSKLSKGAAQPAKRKKSLSPVLQVMKAVTDSALNPKRKKATSLGSGDKVKTDKEAGLKSASGIFKNNGGK